MWPGLYCAVRHYPNMHKEKSPYSKEFITYVAGRFFQRAEWNGGVSFLMLNGSFVDYVFITPVLHKLSYQYPAWISLASMLLKGIMIKNFWPKLSWHKMLKYLSPFLSQLRHDKDETINHTQACKNSILIMRQYLKWWCESTVILTWYRYRVSVSYFHLLNFSWKWKMRDYKNIM